MRFLAELRLVNCRRVCSRFQQRSINEFALTGYQSNARLRR